MTDYRGFDSIDPLSMPGLSRWAFAAIYVHGRRAYRILPESEQAALPAGVGLLPISVISWDSPTGPVIPVTASQGQSDGADYARVLDARGWKKGEAASIDFESGVETVPGAVSYANAMAHVIRQAGHPHYPYAKTEMLDQIVEKDGSWLTYWKGDTTDDGLTRYWRAMTPAFAWQYGGTLAGADLNVCTLPFLRSLRGAVPMEPDSVTFPNGFVLNEGFYQAWAHGGGMVPFGMPISREYDTRGFDGQPVRRRWFERAVGEWRPGQYPGNWDVEWLLLGDMIRNGSGALTLLYADAQTHADAFKAG